MPCPPGISRVVVPSPLNGGWWDVWERDWDIGVWVLVASTTIEESV